MVIVRRIKVYLENDYDSRNIKQTKNFKLKFKKFKQTISKLQRSIYNNFIDIIIGFIIIK